MSEEKQNKYDIELPQAIIDSFARFIVSETRRELGEQVGSNRMQQKSK